MSAPSAAPRDARGSVTRAADIARRYGREAAADHAVALLDAPFRAGTVVVVGEVKRGKSSLINGLVGRRDLLPVDVLTCTSAPIRVRIGGAEAGVDKPEVVLVRGGRREPVPLEEMAQWVTNGAVGVIDPDGESEPPSAAEITLGDAPLPGVTIVDTPGVGGLDEHAVKAAMGEASHAGLLLMVCDASTPITAPEMEILATARQNVGGVLVAVTKTDKNVRRWRAIVEDDRRLIREHLGADVPVVGVSSLRAVDAAELTDPRRRTEIEERSGIADLRREITRLLSDPETIGRRAALDASVHTLRSILSTVESDIRLYDGTSDAVLELETEKAELENIRENSSEWEQRFQRDISLTRNAITEALDRDLDDLRNDWTRRINSDGLRVLRSKPQVFTSQIEVDLLAIMESRVGELVAEITRHARELFPDNPELSAEITARAVASIAPPEVVSREVDKKTKDLADPQMLVMGVMGAGMLAALIPIGLIAGPTWVGINAAYRAMRNGKQHLITWLRETSNTARMSTTRMFDTIITSARTEIMMNFRANLRTRQKELQARVQEAQKAARESESERKDRLTRLRRNAEIIESTITELTAHLEKGVR